MLIRFVVPEDDQPPQFQVPGQGDGLVADALHQAAVAGDYVSDVVHDGVAEAGVAEPLGQGHADPVGQPLPQGPGGGLDAAGVSVLGMAGGTRAQLAEVPQLVDVHILVAGEVQQPVKQHGPVARRQNEAVPVGPAGRGGVELEKTGPQHGRHVGHAHGHARMARIGFLDGVGGEESNGVGQLHVTGAGRRGGGLGRRDRHRINSSRAIGNNPWRVTTRAGGVL